VKAGIISSTTALISGKQFQAALGIRWYSLGTRERVFRAAVSFQASDLETKFTIATSRERKIVVRY